MTAVHRTAATRETTRGQQYTRATAAYKLPFAAISKEQKKRLRPVEQPRTAVRLSCK